MDDETRDTFERDLAVAVLVLWLLFDELRTAGYVDYRAFGALFDEHVRPIISKVYGLARTTLAGSHGVNYPSRDDGNGGQIVSLRNIAIAMDRYRRQLYDSFMARWDKRQQSTSSSTTATPPASRPPTTRPTTQPTSQPTPTTQPTSTPTTPATPTATPSSVLQPTPASTPATSPASPSARGNQVVEAEPEPVEPYPDFTEADAERVAVTTVTDASSHGEFDAARDVESTTGTRLVPIWKTEPGACKVCGPLEGTTRSVWGLQFPEGPPSHPRCRCKLVWRRLI